MPKFIKNLDAKQWTQLKKLRVDEGQKWAEVLSRTGLSHSRAELAIMEYEAEQAGFKWVPLTPAFVAYARTQLQLGWGPIMVWTQSSEGAVRKAWAEATATHSDGQRINRGGRFKFDDQTLYVGELKPTGTAIPKDKPLVREVARDSALTQRLLAKDPKTLKSLYVKYVGKEPGKGWTKAKLVMELRKVNDSKVAENAA